jgi:cell division septal protein FtsQ
MQTDQIDTKKFRKEKLLRFKPIAFVRKNIIFFSIITLFLISLIIGIWKLKNIEVIEVRDSSSQNISQDISTYFEENIKGKNFFKVSSDSLEEEFLNNISYLKSVQVEKKFPNKLIIFVDTYEDKIVGLLNENKCYLLSAEGYLIQSLCEESEDEYCCESFAIENQYLFFASPQASLSMDSNKKERLLVLGSVDKVVKVLESYGYVLSNMTLEADILKLHNPENETFIFDLNDNVELQLERFIVVISKIQSEDIKFESLDLRFERPVVKK